MHEETARDEAVGDMSKRLFKDKSIRRCLKAALEAADDKTKEEHMAACNKHEGD